MMNTLNVDLPPEFEQLVLAGYTVRRIRRELRQLGYNLDCYEDYQLVICMRFVLKDDSNAEVHFS